MINNYDYFFCCIANSKSELKRTYRFCFTWNFLSKLLFGLHVGGFDMFWCSVAETDFHSWQFTFWLRAWSDPSFCCFWELWSCKDSDGGDWESKLWFTCRVLFALIFQTWMARIVYSHLQLHRLSDQSVNNVYRFDLLYFIFLFTF